MRILLAEDRASLRAALAESLERAGFDVAQAGEGLEAMALVEEGSYDLAILDLKMPAHSGLELLEASKARWPSRPVILLTAYGSVETAVSAMKAGADDFLSKPVDPDHLLLVVKRALEADRAGRVYEAMSDDLARHPAFMGIVGKSEALNRAQEEAMRVAQTGATVLLLGETGVGKELFARAIHAASPRARQPFVAVNCAALPQGLLENELFGHEKGSYTGAHESRMGKFELAHRGTLFLDEIGEMHPDLQAKLLRVLEERSFLRIGGLRPVTVDVRLICATNRDLMELAGRNEFRRDLYYRLNAFPITIPPLRERREDIPLLAEAALGRLRRELGRRSLRFSQGTLEAIASQDWPGNVRELMNRIERAAILSGKDGSIGPEAFGGGSLGSVPADDPAPAAQGDPEAFLEAERAWRVRQVVRLCGNDLKKASRLLGMPLPALKAISGLDRNEEQTLSRRGT
jgi:DNA-binding NtrC family response regulator